MVVAPERSGSIAHKRCKRCDVEKISAEFYASSNRADGLRAECKECIKQLSQAAYIANRNLRLEQTRAWKTANQEKVNTFARERYSRNPQAGLSATRRWQLKNTSKRAAYRRKYRHINPAAVVRSEIRRKRAVSQACVAWADSALISAIYSEARRRSKETGVRWEVDHIVPLRHPLVCGLHVHTNLRIVTQAENREKSNRFSVWTDSPSEAVN